MTSGTRSWVRSLAGLAGGVALLAATGHASPSGSAVPKHPDARTILHVLNRLGYGARPGDVERVRQMGLANYVDQQLTPARIPDDPALEARLAALPTLTMGTRQLVDEYFLPARQAQRAAQLASRADAQPATDPSMAAAPAAGGAAESTQPSPELRARRQRAQEVANDLMQARILRAVMSDRQLNEVLVDFWFNHFNVYAGKGQVRDYLTSYERDTIRPHVLGRFRDLLGAVAHSPAMLFYLDNWQSSAPNAGPAIPPQIAQRLADPFLPPAQRMRLQTRLEQVRRQPRTNQAHGLNENYGRELMELHTLGVDGGYTQADVISVARALTGWTIDRPQQGGGFIFKAQMHDTGEKTILGETFPAGREEDEGERVLDLLASSPATAHHIAFELAQRFVADDPPAALVDRAAKTFLDTKGDLRAVVRLIVTSPEFFAPAAYRAKVKSPLEFVVSALRATSATVADARPVVQALNQLGMPLYGCQPPTGYTDTADAWMNTGALLGRMNFALRLATAGGRPGPGGPGRGAFARGRQAGPIGPDAGRPAGRGPAIAPMRIDLAALVPDTSEASQDRLIKDLFAGDVSASTRQALAKATSPGELVALAIGAPEFERR